MSQSEFLQINRDEIEKVFEECGYNPEKIGVHLLRLCGYFVRVPVYSDGPPIVKTNEFGKVLY